MIVKIEPLAGFCFGVVSAINLVEKELKDNDKLYCLGDIVHNNMEVERLSKLGLEVIDIERMKALKNTKVMIRAHGEPPSTYKLAQENNIEIIDATCPIVLKLQQNVRKGYLRMIEIGGTAEDETVAFNYSGPMVGSMLGFKFYFTDNIGMYVEAGFDGAKIAGIGVAAKF